MEYSIIGIDIAKAKFDIALIQNDKFRVKVCKNTPEGFHQLIEWLNKHGVYHVHATMEATGTYWEALAEFLVDAGHQVSVVNPVRIANYAKSIMQRGKTDVQDARLIARFCERERPELWQPTPKSQRELLAMVRQLQHLTDCLQAERNRLPISRISIQASIDAHIRFIEQQIKDLERQIKQHINSDPTLKHNRELLLSIPNIGEKSMAHLLAYLGDGTRFERSNQATAFAGLTPRRFESGSSVHGKSRISKQGHADIRHILFMPALGNYGMKRAFVPFMERLKAAGKAPKEIIVAIMRKLLAIAQAVLKSQTPFNPELHTQ
jgi:transposase